jgi:hypothetical protein
MDMVVVVVCVGWTIRRTKMKNDSVLNMIEIERLLRYRLCCMSLKERKFTFVHNFWISLENTTSFDE